jgi:hypothetical protein
MKKSNKKRVVRKTSKTEAPAPVATQSITPSSKVAPVETVQTPVQEKMKFT